MYSFLFLLLCSTKVIFKHKYRSCRLLTSSIAVLPKNESPFRLTNHLNRWNFRWSSSASSSLCPLGLPPCHCYYPHRRRCLCCSSRWPFSSSWTAVLSLEAVFPALHCLRSSRQKSPRIRRTSGTRKNSSVND